MQLRFESLELDDAVGEAGMLAPEWAPRDRDHAGDLRCIEQGLEGKPAGQSARPGQERDVCARFRPRCTALENRGCCFSDSLGALAPAGKAVAGSRTAPGGGSRPARGSTRNATGSGELARAAWRPSVTICCGARYAP